MGRMNNETKSIAYAFIANGVQIYLGDEIDHFITSKLICSDCGMPWYMNLTECFLCGAINKFLYRCADCKEFVSITNSSGKCTACGSMDLYMVCPNPDCISNKDEALLKEINGYGGVFNRQSGFLISQQYCLYCGSQYHSYKNYKIRVITITSKIMTSNDILTSSSQLTDNSLLIVRVKSGGNISYGSYKVSELNGENIELKNLHTNFTEVIDSLYPKRSNDHNL